MLPYTPLHHLLLRELDGHPAGDDQRQSIRRADRLRRPRRPERLAGIADLFLTHDRPIHVRCDDSVTRVVAGVELPIRRARGEARARSPAVACRVPTLALGGQFKATFALGRGRHAFSVTTSATSTTIEASRAFAEAIAHYERLFDFETGVLVHDLHPDYASTRFAASSAEPGRRSPSSIIMPTWPVAWPRMVWMNRSSA